MHFFNLFFQKRIMLLILFLPFLFASLVGAETIYLDQPREIKEHSMPACTALTKKESRGKGWGLATWPLTYYLTQNI